MYERFMIVTAQAGPEIDPSLVAQIVEAVTGIKTELGLAGLVMLVVYAVLKLVLGKVPQMTPNTGGELLKGVVNWVFVLALVAIVLAMFLHTGMPQRWASGPGHEDPVVQEVRMKNEEVQRIRADYETWVSKQRPKDQRADLTKRSRDAAEELEVLANLHRDSIGDVLHCMTLINAATAYSYAAASAPSTQKRSDAAKSAAKLAEVAVDLSHELIEAARQDLGSDFATAVEQFEEAGNLTRALSVRAVALAIEHDSTGDTRPEEVMEVLTRLTASSSDVLKESISNNREICTFLVSYNRKINDDAIAAWREACRPFTAASMRG